MQDSFGDYKVLERIGGGAAADVFRARDLRAGRTAAIKVLTAPEAMDAVHGQPIADEAYLARTLGHPNAAALYDIGEQDGRPYLVYEFIQGQTLDALLGGKPINPRRALEFAAQVADALADAHALGLVHRSLRTDTVMVSAKGTAKVLDFGLGHYATMVARQAPPSAPAVRYWAPEQHGGPADARSDVFALGLVLVEMLTGRSPDAGDRAVAVGEAPAVVQPLLRRMLADDPAQRVESAATVAAELRQLTSALEAQRAAPRDAAPPARQTAATPGRQTTAPPARQTTAPPARQTAPPALQTTAAPAQQPAAPPSTADARPAGSGRSGPERRAPKQRRPAPGQPSGGGRASAPVSALALFAGLIGAAVLLWWLAF